MEKISYNNFPAGTVFMVRGNIVFSRLMSKVDGEELRRANENAAKIGKTAQNKPYTTIQISNARVLCGDPNNLTPVETAATQRLYTSKKHPERKACFEVFDKGNSLPLIGVVDPENPSVVNGVNLEHDLTTGLDVTVVCEIYKPKMQPNNGVAIARVIVNEPIRYLQTDNIDKVLKEQGVTWNPAPEVEPKTTSTVTPAEPQAVPFNQPQAAPFGQPVTPPQGNPYTTQPTPAPQPAPAPAPAPAPQPAPAPAPGITYTADDRNY